MDVFKRKAFKRWQANEGLSDLLLCNAAFEIENGLIDAHLGGLLFKKRIAREHGGKRDGHRTILSARIGDRCIFLLGFSKSERANITSDETKALRHIGRVILDMTPSELQLAVAAGVLMEVDCEQHTH